jgi:chemosensory pili system protein ChpA (sensor histidine kinase/response regulator)
VPLLNPDLLLALLLALAVGVGVGIGMGLSAGMARLRRRLGGGAAEPAPAAVARRGAAPTFVRPALAPPARPRAPAVPALPQAADLLLVDDSAVARTKLRRLFEGAGYTVQLACDGLEALDLLKQGRYGMMITDLEMPRLDGVTLINTCVAQPHTARMPIMAISGHEGLRAKFNECRDVCGIHRKPWVDDILLSHVAAVVTSSRERTDCLVH